MIGSAIITALMSKEVLIVSGIGIITGIGALVHRKFEEEEEHIALSKLIYIAILLFLVGYSVACLVELFSTIETIFFM